MTGPDLHPTERMAKPHTSVSHVRDDWYIVCRSGDLKNRPIRSEVFETPLVLFRDNTGLPGAMLDRCPHRNVPLSLGRVVENTLQCSYHGWRFDRHGTCQLVPGLLDEAVSRGRSATPYSVCEQDGFIWVYGLPGATPKRQPIRFPLIDQEGYTTVYQELDVQASVHAVAENILDVPHTAYLHGGLFRSVAEQKQEVKVVVTRFHDRVEAEYFGEAPPRGIAARILAPGSGWVVHVDRFILPSIAQVEYRIGARTHFSVTNVLTPVKDFQTKLFTIVSIRLPLPAFLVTPFLRPLAMKIFQQDAHMLRYQSDTIRRFGGEQFVSTEIDVLGSHILRLLRQAEQGDRDTDRKPVVNEIRMSI